MRARILEAVEMKLRRAVEVGIHETVSDAVEAGLARYVDEVLSPALDSGAYDRTLQVQRRLESLGKHASRGPTPAEVARELVQGLKRQAETNGDLARQFIQRVEEELVETGGPWERRVLELLNSYPRWLELRERS